MPRTACDFAILAVKQPLKRGPQAFFLLINAVRLLEPADFDDRHRWPIIRAERRDESSYVGTGRDRGNRVFNAPVLG